MVVPMALTIAKRILREESHHKYQRFLAALRMTNFNFSDSAVTNAYDRSFLDKNDLQDPLVRRIEDRQVFLWMQLLSPNGIAL